jgi:hypothetical protein
MRGCFMRALQCVGILIVVSLVYFKLIGMGPHGAGVVYFFIFVVPAVIVVFLCILYLDRRR